MMLRPIDEGEIEKLLKAVEDLTSASREAVAIKQLLREIAAAERAVPAHILQLEPYLSPDQLNLYFRLRYEGYRPLCLQSVVVGIPKKVKNPEWRVSVIPGHMEVEKKTMDEVPYIFQRYLANSGASSPYGFKVLPSTLNSSNEARDLPELRFELDRNTDGLKPENEIRWCIETSDHKTDWVRIPMSTLKP